MKMVGSMRRLGALSCAAVLPACMVRPPTIAHVHLGHAITAVHVTPGHKGYLTMALLRSGEALQDARSAAGDTDLVQLKLHVAAVVDATDSTNNFGPRESLSMAANHVSFAATSPDASANLIRSAPVFERDITVTIGRCDYIAAEIFKLARANLEGDDSDNDGVSGSAPAEYGVVLLRAEVEAMVDRENPPYRTVDDRYLFNLVRLPNGRWVYDKLGRGGNIDGYK